VRATALTWLVHMVAVVPMPASCSSSWQRCAWRTQQQKPTTQWPAPPPNHHRQMAQQLQQRQMAQQTIRCPPYSVRSCSSTRYVCVCVCVYVCVCVCVVADSCSTASVMFFHQVWLSAAHAHTWTTYTCDLWIYIMWPNILATMLFNFFQLLCHLYHFTQHHPSIVYNCERRRN
jgi:hypothetical protein